MVKSTNYPAPYSLRSPNILSILLSNRTWPLSTENYTTFKWRMCQKIAEDRRRCSELYLNYTREAREYSKSWPANNCVVRFEVLTSVKMSALKTEALEWSTVRRSTVYAALQHTWRRKKIKKTAFTEYGRSLPTFRRCLLSPSSWRLITLMMETNGRRQPSSISSQREPDISPIVELIF
jgi:hypothetical protein